ncbi:MAG: alkaline phosphatase family protein [Cyanobacteria bacterium J06623_4]
MKKRVIFIILDGLRFDVAGRSMGYLAHLVESKQASFFKVKAELPTLSRPLYEVLLTGVPASTSGITANEVARLSHQVSVFHLAVQQGLTTAAAAYHWFSELYNSAPFDPFTEREQHSEANPIQHGKFYFADDYPDSHLFADAEVLRLNWQPDFMLVHPMGIDYTGHRFGGESAAYRNAAIATDSLLAQYIPRWLEAGYTLVITADHGMNADKSHGGLSPDVREVPLFCMGPDFEATTPQNERHLEGIPQLAIAPLLCRLLGIPTTDAMQTVPVPWLRQKSFAPAD